MKFEYLPQVVGLQHPFRYINGVQMFKGLNNISPPQSKILNQSELFQDLIAKGAVIVETNKKKPAEAKTITPPEVKEEKPSLTPVSAEAKPEVKEEKAMSPKKAKSVLDFNLPLVSEKE
jgi:hypothetical protein